MSKAVASPDPFATRAHAADWLELMAIASFPAPYRSSEYVGSLALAADKPDGEVAPELQDEDEEILDNEFDTLIEAATEEIRWRADTLNDLYPFELRVTARSWSISFTRSDEAPVRLAQDVYSTCLIMSSTRHGRLDGLPLQERSVKKIADVFQAAVFLIAPALLGGPSFWIAFPRPEKDDYGPSLQRLVREIGIGELTERRPPTQTRNKDGGVDIVTWRDFPDGRSNIIISYGQVATGKGWREKSVHNKLHGYFLKWLATRPTKHFIPAMYIPHVMHENITPTKTTTYEEMAREEAHDLEATLGVVIDRIRMTALTPEAFRIREAGSRRGMSSVHQLRKWHVRVVNHLRQS